MQIMEKIDAQSYYAASANDTPNHPALTEDIQVDVCIIGGGMTGSSAALTLAEAGTSCCILEAKHIAWGASGRSGGQMIVGLNRSYEWLSDHTDPATAMQLWKASVEGINLIEHLCQKHDIKCDLMRGHYHVGLKERHAVELHEMHDEYEQMGFKGSKVFEGNEVQQHVCSPLYKSAFYDPISGHLHPLNYTLGLAKAARKAGVEIFERTPVQKVTRTDNSGYVVHTITGKKVHAQKILLATNAYIDGLERRIEPYIMPVGTYITATEPMSTEQAESLIPNRSAVADINFVLNYYRLSADNRMLFGGRATYSAVTPIGLKQVMSREMRKVFPQLVDTAIEYTWGGYVAITQNRLPHVGRLPADNNIFYAQGYSGHGVILSTVCGKILAEAMLGDDAALRCFEAIKHRKFFGGKFLRTPALIAAMSYFKLRDLL